MMLKALLLATTLIPFLASAHPVAFRDATGIMGSHTPQLSHGQINYSLRHWFAPGVHHIKKIHPKGGRSATFASANFLLKRWNGKALQANLYTAWGVGQSNLTKPRQSVGYGMLQFDIEDRQYYFFAKQSRLFNGDRNDFRLTTLRVGFAPYVEDFNGIHAWLILEWERYRFESPQPHYVKYLTPLLRIFYKTVLFEIGHSFEGVSKFNYITHF